MTFLDDRRFLTGYAALVLFTGLASDALRNSLSWYGFGAIVLFIAVLSVAVLRRHRVLSVRAVGWPLVAFLVLATVSLAWSFYPLASALGITMQWVTTSTALAVGLVLTRHELLGVLGLVFRLILGLSLVFELIVATIIRAPVLPVWVTGADRIDPPPLLYWSRDLLLVGDRIQGIVGSSSLLAMAALSGLIVFGIELAVGRVRRATGILSLALAVAMIALTRSATILLACVAVGVALALMLLLRRAVTTGARVATYAGIVAGAAALVIGALAARSSILALLGKSEDLTGRIGIWTDVIALAQQRPVFGWGWISFWAPWVEPFSGYIVRNGVVQLHAHDAWLDVWLQLGFVGLAVFAALVLTTFVRAWRTAADPALVGGGRTTAHTLLAPLLMVALIMQSIAESRILIEGGWMLLVILTVTTRSPLRERGRRRLDRSRPSSALLGNGSSP